MHKWNGIGPLSLVMATLLCATQAFAVDWYVSVNGNDGYVGTSWDTAFATVQQALNEAASGDTIHLAGQTFSIEAEIAWTTSGITMRGGYQGVETDPNALPGAHDPAQWPTVIARSGLANHRILLINGAANSTLEHVTLRGGYLTTGFGGGVHVAGSAGVVFSDCVIAGNAISIANARGGGLYATGSELTLINCVVTGNAANGAGNTSSYGGGVWSDGKLTIRHSMILQNQLTINNTGWYQGYGGGIHFSGTEGLLQNVLVAWNRVQNPRGLVLGAGVQANAATHIKNCTIAHNAGLAVVGAGSVTDSIVRGNWDLFSGVTAVSYSNLDDPDYAGLDNNIDADPLFEYGYYLGGGSPSRDAGSDTAANLGLDDRTTRTDGVTDAGTVDMGFHYPAGFDLAWADLYVSPDGHDDNPGTGPAPAEAFRTVTRALAEAREGSRIHVASGHYTIDTGEVFPLAADELPGLSILGAGAEDTVFDAAGTNRQVMALTSCAGASLSGLTLTGGFETVGNGGGLYLFNSQEVLLTDCIVTGNQVQKPWAYGGGIYASYSDLTLVNCLVKGNSGHGTGNSSSFGGGISSDGMLTLHHTRVLANQLIYNNINAAYRGHGGGIYFNATGSGTELWLHNSLVAWNSNQNAHNGLFGAGIHATPSTHIRNSTVAHNAGYGLVNAGSVTDSIVQGNWTDVSGPTEIHFSNIGDPAYAGVNNNISADPLFEHGYYLADGSPSRDAGSDTAANLGLDSRTTRTDGVTDAGLVDMGFHYPAGFDLAWADLYVSPDGHDDNPGTGPAPAAAFRTVTRAMTAAREGSRIHVAAGHYTTATGEVFPLAADALPGLRLLGAGAAETVLDAADANRRVMTVRWSPGLLLSGLTLANGHEFGDDGGGLYLFGSQQVRLADCVILNNTAQRSGVNGGGIYAPWSDLTLTGCRVQGNRAFAATHNQANGGGIWSDGKLTLEQTLLLDNTAQRHFGTDIGGGLYFVGVSAVLRNVLVAGNNCFLNNQGDGIAIMGLGAGRETLLENVTISGNQGEGLRRTVGTTVILRNSIVWGNDGSDLFGVVEAAYSNIGTGAYTDKGGNLSVDPEFVDTTYYHLRSPMGHYVDGYFSGGSWSSGRPNSPLIAAGDPDSDFSLEPQPNGGLINLGAYGNTPVASKFTPSGTIILIR